MAISPQLPTQNMPGASGASEVQVSRAGFAGIAPIRMQPLGRPVVPPLQLGSLAAGGAAQSARARSAGGAEELGAGAGAVTGTHQRRASLAEGTSNNASGIGGAAAVAQSARGVGEGWRRLSHDGVTAAAASGAAAGTARVLPEVSAADRRELLKQYQAQKQQRQTGGSGGGGEGPGLPKAGRLSLGGAAPTGFGKPPIGASRAPIPRAPAHMPKPMATTVVAHAAATPLPDAGSDAGDGALASPEPPQRHGPAPWADGGAAGAAGQHARPNMVGAACCDAIAQLRYLCVIVDKLSSSETC